MVELEEWLKVSPSNWISACQLLLTTVLSAFEEQGRDPAEVQVLRIDELGRAGMLLLLLLLPLLLERLPSPLAVV